MPPRASPPSRDPPVVRHRDAARFLWGDSKSGEIADVIYGRSAGIGTLVFKLKPGGYFKSSDGWKSFFDQHRFYYVLKGEIAVQDPETGEIAVAKAGEAVHWRGAKWHFGYNFKAEECCRPRLVRPAGTPAPCHGVRVRQDQAEIREGEAGPRGAARPLARRAGRDAGRGPEQGRDDHRAAPGRAAFRPWRRPIRSWNRSSSAPRN